MTVRTFRHALTGRSITVREDTRIERLVEADRNWTEVDDKPKAKETDRGTGNRARRRGPARPGSDDD